MLNRLKLIIATTVITTATLVYGTASAYDAYTINNLKRSRDALLDQQTELQKAYDDTSRQVDTLQQKLTRINNYLNQINLSLRDVDRALDQTQ